MAPGMDEGKEDDRGDPGPGGEGTSVQEDKQLVVLSKHCPVLRAPELDTGLPGQVSAEQGREAESPPSPCAYAAGDAAQGTLGLLGCQLTLPGPGQLLIPQHPQVLLCRADLNPLILQPVLIVRPRCRTLHFTLLNLYIYRHGAEQRSFYQILCNNSGVYYTWSILSLKTSRTSLFQRQAFHILSDHPFPCGCSFSLGQFAHKFAFSLFLANLSGFFLSCLGKKTEAFDLCCLCCNIYLLVDMPFPLLFLCTKQV